MSESYFDGTTIDFNEPPIVFNLGDRVHLKTTKVMKATTGTVVELQCDPQILASPPPANLAVVVRWDGGGTSTQSNIALERLN